jgi:hypothetical protein
MAKQIEDGDNDVSNAPGAFEALKPTGEVPDLEADAKFVEYHGRAGRRTITAAQWEQAGIDGQSEVTWSAENNKRVRASMFTPEALDALRVDGSFAVPAAE